MIGLAANRYVTTKRNVSSIPRPFIPIKAEDLPPVMTKVSYFDERIVIALFQRE